MSESLKSSIVTARLEVRLLSTTSNNHSFSVKRGLDEGKALPL